MSYDIQKIHQFYEFLNINKNWYKKTHKIDVFLNVIGVAIITIMSIPIHKQGYKARRQFYENKEKEIYDRYQAFGGVLPEKYRGKVMSDGSMECMMGEKKCKINPNKLHKLAKMTKTIGKHVATTVAPEMSNEIPKNMSVSMPEPVSVPVIVLNDDDLPDSW